MLNDLLLNICRKKPAHLCFHFMIAENNCKFILIWYCVWKHMLTMHLEELDHKQLFKVVDLWCVTLKGQGHQVDLKIKS